MNQKSTVWVRLFQCNVLLIFTLKFLLKLLLSRIILSLASFLVLLGTLIEILELLEFVDFKKHSWCEGMRSFSAINNTRILFSLEGEGKKSAEDEQFQYIHGVRALVSFVVIYFHATHYTPVKVIFLIIKIQFF